LKLNVARDNSEPKVTSINVGTGIFFTLAYKVYINEYNITPASRTD
jgi:hypothetical protein